MIFKKPEKRLAYTGPEFSVRGIFATTILLQKAAKN
jgi:hypothetical protein